MKLFEFFGLEPTPLMMQKAFVCGLECEIEAVKTAPNIHGIVTTQDGSLRNPHAPNGHGHEFITQPWKKADALDAFKKLHTNLVFWEGEDPFSPRTSTHVHVNCMNLETTQIRNIILLYALYEDFFFLMVDPLRRDNIHCVPLTETHLSTYYKRPLELFVERWSKYTALNILPMRKLGTLEFRHLQGTGDVSLLKQWLDVLDNLWVLGQRVVIDAQALSNKDLLRQWFDTIFEPAPEITKYRPMMFDLIRNSLIDVKFSTVA